MAGRLRGNITSRSSFTDDPQLRQYFLDGVCPTGKELGRGSYGVVVEVYMCCALLFCAIISYIPCAYLTNLGYYNLYQGGQTTVVLEKWFPLQGE